MICDYLNAKPNHLCAGRGGRFGLMPKYALPQSHSDSISGTKLFLSAFREYRAPVMLFHRSNPQWRGQRTLPRIP